jgi:beta-N-acetylhexosaminidase
VTGAPAAAVLGLPGPGLDADARAILRADPWGVILFARNVETPAQLTRLTAGIRDALGRAAPILIDQEGGRVARLRPPHWRGWPAPLDAARAAGPRAERALWLRHRLIAAELAVAGIDVNCAPCADLAGPDTHPFLANRCLGATPAEVIPRARAAAEGLLAGGVLPVVKHLPGHGRATADSHHALPRVAATAAELRGQDFAVFAGLADLPLAMTCHVAFSAFDDAPATLSPRMIRLIRDEIGFAGLLLSDDLGMEALSGSPPQRSAAARAAGCDIALLGNGTPAELIATAEAAGPLEGPARARAESALAARRAPEPADIDALAAELARLAPEPAA